MTICAMLIHCVLSSVVEVGFSEGDYTADEGEPTLGRRYTPCRVTVEVINGRLELPLPIQLTPRAGSATGDCDICY